MSHNCTCDVCKAWEAIEQRDQQRGAGFTQTIRENLAEFDYENNDAAELPINDTPDLVMLPFIDGGALCAESAFPGFIKFQTGPVGIVARNGTSLEAVLTVCLDRLNGYQRGRFPCPENDEAVRHIAAAIDALDLRTVHRRRQGVEGLNVPHRA